MIARERVVTLFAYVLLVAVVAYYGLIHWRVIWSVVPVAARETAFVANMKGYLDFVGPRPYSLESLPGHTNVYGIGYLWGAAPFARFLPFDMATSLRIANAFYLGLLLVAIGYGGRSAPLITRCFLLTLIYALFVSSPSVAAGPDILACLFYVLAFLVAFEGQLKCRALLVSIVLGFLALLTKPYLVLVVPAIGAYLLFFRSVKSWTVYTLSVVAFFGAGLGVIRLLYPYYFTSIFAVHLAAAVRDPLIALKQWGEFLLLAPIPAAVGIHLYQRWMRSNAPTLRWQFSWSAPLLEASVPISLYAWGAWLAIAALAGSLAWHTGAYLIYFWHLLLPLLLLLQVRHASVRNEWLCLNLLVLLVLRPPLPPEGTPVEWRNLQGVVASHPRIYLDPFLDSLKPENLGNPNRENAESEYLEGLVLAAKAPSGKAAIYSFNGREIGYATHLASTIAGDTGALVKRCQQIRQARVRAFANEDYDGILLTDWIFYQEHLMPTILSRYKITGAYELYPYYAAFRNRRGFGRAALRVFLLEPRK